MLRKSKRNRSRSNWEQTSNTITAETSFKEDLGADSLDLFEMVMSLEDTCGVEIPTEDLETMVTVGDVAEYLEQHKN